MNDSARLRCLLRRGQRPTLRRCQRRTLRWRRAFRIGVGLVAGSLALADGRAVAVSGEAAVRVSDSATMGGNGTARWRRLEDGFGRGGMGRAIALGSAGDRAVGDAGGVTWTRGAQRLRADLPAVRGLAFSGRETLWVGTLDGLYRWSPDGRPTRHRLLAGEAAERIADLAAVGESLVVASDGGLFWSTAGKRFQRLPTGGVASSVARVAAARLPGDAGPGARIPTVRIWAAGPFGIHALRGLPAPSGLRVLSSRPLPPVRPGQDAELVDLVHARATGQLIAVHADALAAWTVTAGPDAVRLDGGWRRARPSLPPGARLRALHPGPEGFWLATDRGLLFASQLGGPFVRVGREDGASDCVDLARKGDGALHVLCRGGTFVASSGAAEPPARDEIRALAPAPSSVSRVPVASASVPAGAVGGGRGGSRTGGSGTGASDASPSAVLTLPPDPPLEMLRSRALARSGLDASWTARLRRGLELRGYWPEVELGFGADFDDDHRRDDDQSFVSGDTRRLFDRSRDRGRHFEATLRLDWDLGEILYPEDSVDLSRELRQIVSLRDDIADEINALYFERQRLREQLARGEPGEAGEAARVRARALEIEAGLDAWTGGFITRWRRHAASHERDAGASLAPLSRSRSNRNPTP